MTGLTMHKTKMLYRIKLFSGEGLTLLQNDFKRKLFLFIESAKGVHVSKNSQQF
jgi:hypothetical protein